MIIDLPNTRTREISAKIDELHEERGESATGRVLTLLIRTDDAELENSLEVANAASREHPCRVIAIVPNTHASIVSGEGEATSESENAADESNLDAQVRFGADAGAGEVIVLRPRNGLVNHLDTLVIPLLVPDAPVVAWWPTNPPSNPSKDLLGAMASSRITDAMRSSNPEATIERLRRNWSAQDVDLSWTRLTVWRAMLASMVDQPPHIPIVHARVTAPNDFLPADLLRAWLRLKLNVPVDFEVDENATAVTGVYLTRQDGGVLSLERPHEDQSIISVPGQTPQPISVPVRTLEDCLTEELRRMDPDEVYADVINKGWDLISH
ncbi:glucose-6-phosphate dehydrogenase assembly protein OpcA [Bifidobacterium sp.]|uniref:glucose-6-phosphate dehydrogenase assembly protein OpcA n=1 Tax=Bifidobacterium sp. TaxID=41200 RepID=UPI002A912B7B|nr:glucose-6-phosphate dehydrogenase assembly protein OpcA [Bifidobacterium sp.]MDY5367977.1 glucose-6-phosphate dehydrogenase assembly protein OpcA [Bifidobacterium sp.]